MNLDRPRGPGRRESGAVRLGVIVEKCPPVKFRGCRGPGSRARLAGASQRIGTARVALSLRVLNMLHRASPLVTTVRLRHHIS